jgi:hypothetical protein
MSRAAGATQIKKALPGYILTAKRYEYLSPKAIPSHKFPNLQEIRLALGLRNTAGIARLRVGAYHTNHVGFSICTNSDLGLVPKL